MAGDLEMLPRAKPRRPALLDPTVEAVLAQAAATRELAASNQDLASAQRELAGAILGLEPAAHALGALAEAQQKFCVFLRQHRVKLLGSVPLVVVIINGLSPNAARAVAQLLKAWGVN